MIRHLGIVLDGNRRFAKELMKRPWEGHKYGLVKAREAIQWACEYGIKHVTAYMLSLENMATRPKKELSYILSYMEKEADNILNDKTHVVHRFKIKVNFIGRVGMLPDHLQKKFADVEHMTKNYKKHVLNCAVAYGGQQEITDAVRQIVNKVMDGSIKLSALSDPKKSDIIVSQNLYTADQPSPDMIIRTGGEKRLSNFLPYQSAYSELFFIDKRWPEMQRQDFLDAFEDFESRQRRFGR